MESDKQLKAISNNWKGEKLYQLPASLEHGELWTGEQQELLARGGAPTLELDCPAESSSVSPFLVGKNEEGRDVVDWSQTEDLKKVIQFREANRNRPFGVTVPKVLLDILFSFNRSA